MTFINDLQKVLRKNIRDYGMFIALFVIWGVFAILTDGVFLSSRNLSNLLNQFGYIAVLGIGVTLVIVIRHIDLSIGFWPASWGRWQPSPYPSGICPLLSSSRRC